MSNPATRKEALQLLQDEGWNVVPVQEFEVRRLEREDCWGVARCFYAVNGPTYPFDYPYIPDRLWNENQYRTRTALLRLRPMVPLSDMAPFTGVRLLIPDFTKSASIWCCPSTARLPLRLNTGVSPAAGRTGYSPGRIVSARQSAIILFPRKWGHLPDSGSAPSNWVSCRLCPA